MMRAADGQDAHSLYEQENSRLKITTFCKYFDEFLGGGISTGRVFEFCGPPAVGKTQIGIQLALAVQVPCCFGGLQGRALYIDTEGGLTTSRINEMAAAILAHLQHLNTAHPSLQRAEAMKGLSVDSLLDGIAVLRATTVDQQCASIEILDQYLVEDASNLAGQTRLIVVDSISAQLSHGFGAYAKRGRALATVSEQFMALSSKYPAVAIVLMNQVTTKLTNGQNPALAPALGDSWAQTATDRVDLRWDGQGRMATLAKSPLTSRAGLKFAVIAGGVRGTVFKRKEAAE